MHERTIINKQMQLRKWKLVRFFVILINKDVVIISCTLEVRTVSYTSSMIMNSQIHNSQYGPMLYTAFER